MNDDSQNKTLDGIKSKLGRVATNIKQSLISASSDLSRSFIISERDFLSICLLALKSINEDQIQTNQLTAQSNRSNQTKDNTPEIEMTGGQKKKNFDQRDANLLKKEILKIINASNFNNEAKSVLIQDAYERFKKNKALQKQKLLSDKFRTAYPSVLTGGGGGGTDPQKTSESENEDKHSDKNDQEKEEKKETKRKTKLRTSRNNENEKKNGGKIINEEKKETENKNKKQNTKEFLNTQKNINVALKSILFHMNKKINIIFLENVKFHAECLTNFFKNNPNAYKYFKIKKNYIYLKDTPTAKIELSKFLTCLSFTKTKIYKFLSYKDKQVKRFSKNETRFLELFKSKMSNIVVARVPCKNIRNIIK